MFCSLVDLSLRLSLIYDQEFLYSTAAVCLTYDLLTDQMCLVVRKIKRDLHSAFLPKNSNIKLNLLKKPKKIKIKSKKSAKGKNQGNMWGHVGYKQNSKKLCGSK
jgi:hypothetical protein